jgi:uncharacterized membrane protein (UPF0127 family)
MYQGISEPHKRQYVRYGIGALVILGMLGFGIWYTRPALSDSHLIVFPGIAAHAGTTPESSISFELATTTAAQELGLGGRADISPNYGMLFVFDKDGEYGFWMKDMRVPLDIIWLSDTGDIVHIERSVSPDSYPRVFYPGTPARYVLEMRAGQAALRKWEVGSRVALPLPYGKTVTL